MGILGALLERRNGAPSTLANPADWLRCFFGGGGPTRSGVSIDATSAMAISTVWACVRAISEDVAKLPFKVYRRRADGGKIPEPGHPVHRLLNAQPNDDTTALLMREALTSHTVLRGNGYAEIELSHGGAPLKIHPLAVDEVEPFRRESDKRLAYRVRRNGRSAVVLDSSQVLHLRGLGGDGVTGYSVVRHARESMGLTAAAEQFGARFFGQGARPSGILSHPARLQPEARARLQKDFGDLYGGLDNAAKTILLMEGMTWQQTTIPPDDAQFLETRQFQVPEICRWFRMKPHKVADLSRATFSNIEHQDLEYVGDALLGWFVRWEQECNIKLFSRAEQDAGFFVEHLAAALLRGDLKSRTESYAIGRQWGWFCANEVRRLENMDPLPPEIGDQYIVPVNMTTPQKLEQGPAPGTVPPPGGTKPPASDTDEPASDARSTAHPEPDARTLANMLTTAQLPVLEESVGRLLRAEADKARRANSKGKLTVWAAEFYPGWHDTVRSALMPSIDAVNQSMSFILGRAPKDAGWVGRAAKSIADAHTGSGLHTCNMDNPSDIPAEFDRWESADTASKHANRCAAELAAAAIEQFSLPTEPTP